MIGNVPRLMVSLRIPSSRYVAGYSPTSVSLEQNYEDNDHRESTPRKPPWIPFAKAQYGPFTQEKPKLTNTFIGDLVLQRFLQRHLPKEVFHHVKLDFMQFGEAVAANIRELGRECELQLPKLIFQDAWGNRTNDLWTCPAWKKMHEISAKEGLISIAYERKFAEWSRLYQMSKLYLYAPSAGLYTCPLAMTDGAAKTLEQLQDSKAVFRLAYQHLIDRNPAQFWTSGQWMTEKKGGSDVASGTETVAVPQEDGTFRLFGYKWFSSATDANMALTLARIVDSGGKVIAGTKGLTLFYVETRQPDGSLNNIQIIRLKDKLGTRQVPTAELLLDGSIAHQMFAEGRGVAGITSMLTITRIHNAVAAVSGMRRILNLARDYAQRRNAFGCQIGQYPLHMQTLARMEVEVRGSTLMVLELCRLLGRLDCNIATEHEVDVFRIMNPIAKLYTAKQAMSVVSEGLEAFGGQGYMEDTGLPSMLRDAQVLPIWEGTTNILALDVLRSIAKSNGSVLKAFQTDVIRRLSLAESSYDLAVSRNQVMKALQSATDFIQAYPDILQTAARDFAYTLSRIYIGALMIENASWSGATSEDFVAAQRWCQYQDLFLVSRNQQLNQYSSASVSDDAKLVMEGYEE